MPAGSSPRTSCSIRYGRASSSQVVAATRREFSHGGRWPAAGFGHAIQNFAKRGYRCSRRADARRARPGDRYAGRARRGPRVCASGRGSTRRTCSRTWALPISRRTTSGRPFSRRGAVAPGRGYSRIDPSRRTPPGCESSRTRGACRDPISKIELNGLPRLGHRNGWSRRGRNHCVVRQRCARLFAVDAVAPRPSPGALEALDLASEDPVEPNTPIN